MNDVRALSTLRPRAPDHRPSQPPQTDDSAFGTVLDLQRTIGNAAVVQLFGEADTDRVPGFAGPVRSTAHSSPVPQWNERARRGRASDPERRAGVLPFIARGTGWEGEQIANNLSQLDIAVPRNDAVSCVEVSFVAELVLRGPAAVRQAMAGYLAEYRTRLESRSTPAALRRRTYRASVVLEAAIQSLDSQTMTYAQLAQLPRAMFTFTALADPRRGTNAAEEQGMAEREGFTVTPIDEVGVTRGDAAARAAGLLPGEFFSCGIDASPDGTGPVNHWVHIGRSANGELYFYDPWPRRGTQRITLDERLFRIEEYFVGRSHGRTVQRTFRIVSRFTPPAR